MRAEAYHTLNYASEVERAAPHTFAAFPPWLTIFFDGFLFPLSILLSWSILGLGTGAQIGTATRKSASI